MSNDLDRDVREAHEAKEQAPRPRFSIATTPPPVTAYALLNVVYITVVLARSTSLWQHHPGRGVAVALLLFLWLAAIVVWRQRWAWLLMVLLEGSIVLSPVWGSSSPLIPYVINAVNLALLVTPAMRRWARVTHRSREPARA